MDQELKQILSFEKESSLSWFDWWNYWAPSIGIIIFISIFLFIVACYHSMSPRKEMQPNQSPNEQEMELLVNTLLHQKRLTL